MRFSQDYQRYLKAEYQKLSDYPYMISLIKSSFWKERVAKKALCFEIETERSKTQTNILTLLSDLIEPN